MSGLLNLEKNSKIKISKIKGGAIVIVTVHSKHTIQPKQFTPCKQSGWQWIIENRFTPAWKPVPEWVKAELKLHPQMGVCSGNLVTHIGSIGIDRFCQRVNSISVGG
jgi:hypothetical protein